MEVVSGGKGYGDLLFDASDCRAACSLFHYGGARMDTLELKQKTTITSSLPGCVAIAVGLFCIIEIEVIIWVGKILWTH